MPAGCRVYAVGDVHGRLDLLDMLLETIRADSATRPDAEVIVILLGDLIDRGPDSRGVVKRVRAGLDWARMIPLMGNHEAIMLNALDGDFDQLRLWLRHGGVECLLSWGVPQSVLTDGSIEEIMDAARAALSADDLGWISQLDTSARIGDYYFVHAGIRPGTAIDEQDGNDLLWIRDDFIRSQRLHGAMIVHGHSISTEVERRPNRIGLDTGAYRTGRLSAVGIEGKESWLLSAEA